MTTTRINWFPLCTCYTSSQCPDCSKKHHPFPGIPYLLPPCIRHGKYLVTFKLPWDLSCISNMDNRPHLLPSSSRTLQKRVSLDIKGLQHINPNQRVTCAVTDIPQAHPKIKAVLLTFLVSLHPIVYPPPQQTKPTTTPQSLSSLPLTLITIPPRPAGRPPWRRQEPTAQTTAVLVSNPQPVPTSKLQRKRERDAKQPNNPTTQPTIKNKPLTKSQKTTPPPPAAPPPAVVVTTYLPTASPSRPPSSPARGYPPCPRRPCCSGGCCS